MASNLKTDLTNKTTYWRLNTFLREAGLGSRRYADGVIKAGLVTVNGVAVGCGAIVSATDLVMCHGRRWRVLEKSLRIWLYHKPRGVICTFSSKERPNLKDKLHLGEDFFPVGRLDKESEGLLLLTNCGQTAQRLQHPSFGHEKEYIVSLNRVGQAEMCNSFVNGVRLEDGLSFAVSAEWLDEKTMRLVLRQGKNRQIRRMCEFFGYKVIRLVRVRFGDLRLDVAVGKWRILSKKERETIIDGGVQVDDF